jgi:hypothetical protein
VFIIDQYLFIKGEDSLSFAYGSIGKKATKGEFSNYGSTFGLNDVIGVYLVSRICF